MNISVWCGVVYSFLFNFFLSLTVALTPLNETDEYVISFSTTTKKKKQVCRGDGH